MGHCSAWPRLRPTIAPALLLAIGFTRPSTTEAKPSDSDGVYGRLDGEIALSPSVGLEHYRGEIQAAIGLQATYLSTVGVLFHHADSRLLIAGRSDRRDMTAIELAVNPLFLTRWSQALEVGPSLLDLAIDSFRVGLGVCWDYDHNSRDWQRGTLFSSGLGVPLYARASGPWLNATVALRLQDGPGFSAPTNVTYGLALSWNWFIDARLHDDNP